MTDDRYRNEHMDKPTFTPAPVPTPAVTDKDLESALDMLASPLHARASNEQYLAAAADKGMLPWTYSDAACSLAFSAAQADGQRITACLELCQWLSTEAIRGMIKARYKLDFRAP